MALISVDQNILKHMIDSQAEFLMEVTDKTKADVKVFQCLVLSCHYGSSDQVDRVVL